MVNENNATASNAATDPSDTNEGIDAATQNHYHIMITYLVEQLRGEVRIPLEYLQDKMEGRAPAELTVVQLTDGDVLLKVESADVKGRIMVLS